MRIAAYEPAGYKQISGNKRQLQEGPCGNKVTKKSKQKNQNSALVLEWKIVTYEMSWIWLFDWRVFVCLLQGVLKEIDDKVKQK